MFRIRIISTISVLLIPFTIHATTLVKRGFNEAIERSGFIFEGEVLSKYTSFSEDNLTIYTFVTFSKRDVLKGTIPNEQIELRFVGGEVNGIVLNVPGMPTFEIGEKGIYFLKFEYDPTKTISPVYGFENGKFLIQTDSQQVDRIYTAKKGKIFGYENEKGRLIEELNPKQTKNVPIQINGTNDKLVETKSLREAQESITKDQFKSLITQSIQKTAEPNRTFQQLEQSQKLKSIIFNPAQAPRTTPVGEK